jgi:hypothetical protein
MSAPDELHGAAGESDTAVTRRTAELVIGVLLALFGLLAIVSNYQIGAGWASDGPQAGYFPLRMGVIILFCSIIVIAQALAKNDRSAFVERAQLRLVATVLLPLIVYVAAIQFTGIYVASAIFIGAFMAFIGKFSWWKAAGVGAGFSLALFWIFEFMFQVPLPKGPIEALFGF